MKGRTVLIVFVAALLMAVLLGTAGTATAAPQNASPTVHVVRYGENLTMIAARYGVSVAAIMQANGLRNANFVYAGQRLVIPPH